LLRVGLTGGIGSGKTTVARIFEALGIPVYYSDDAAKRLMNTDPAIRRQLIEEFGSEVYNADQTLNRAHLAALVFPAPQKLARLNAITHPVTIADSEQWMKRQSTPYAIKEAALLVEAGADQYLDFLIGVTAPEQLRIARVMKRDNVTEEQVRERMKRQMSEEEKMKRCNAVLYNDEQTLLIPQVLLLHQQLLEKAGTHSLP
jgi:dephospho-CoA kinase